uniref:(northern house mosquito) hypothetical protein n=1 Tax=Culex pipiens TaxID=7175 RepID=A0A8D8A5S5_CULPI
MVRGRTGSISRKVQLPDLTPCVVQHLQKVLRLWPQLIELLHKLQPIDVLVDERFAVLFSLLLPPDHGHGGDDQHDAQHRSGSDPDDRRQERAGKAHRIADATHKLRRRGPLGRVAAGTVQDALARVYPQQQVGTFDAAPLGAANARRMQRGTVSRM